VQGGAVKKFLPLVIVALLAWGYGKLQGHPPEPQQPSAAPQALRFQGAPTQTFACKGKTHCSEMRSCDEAKFYLAHCPFPKMDGDGDGIPCEDQWCGH
jgi:hypothetical protein